MRTAHEGVGPECSGPTPSPAPGVEIEAAAAAALEKFYKAVMWALDDHVHSRRGYKGAPTVVGFGPILKRLGVEHGIAAANTLPLPRLSRSEFEDQGELSERDRALAHNGVKSDRTRAQNVKEA